MGYNVDQAITQGLIGGALGGAAGGALGWGIKKLMDRIKAGNVARAKAKAEAQAEFDKIMENATCSTKDGFFADNWETIDGVKYWCQDPVVVVGHKYVCFPVFATLWKNYPHSPDGQAPKHPSRDGYTNQCAISLGYALARSKVDLSTFPGKKTSEGYPRFAKQLAKWISKKFGPPKIMSSSDFYNNDTLQGIFFGLAEPQDFNHIDIIKGDSVGSGVYESHEVWYWHIK